MHLRPKGAKPVRSCLLQRRHVPRTTLFGSENLLSCCRRNGGRTVCLATGTRRLCIIRSTSSTTGFCPYGFLTLSIAISDAVASYLGELRLGDIIREGFLICGWSRCG